MVMASLSVRPVASDVSERSVTSASKRPVSSSASKRTVVSGASKRPVASGASKRTAASGASKRSKRALGPGLSHRAEIFRSKLIEEFQILETTSEQGKRKVPVYSTTDVISKN